MFIRFFTVFFLTVVLTACGGGGGSAGSSGSSSSSGSGSGTGGSTSGSGATATPPSPTLTLSVIDELGRVDANNEIGGGNKRIRARLLDGSGSPIVNGLVEFAQEDDTYSTFIPASGKQGTNVSGIADVVISPKSSASGAASVTATAKVGSVTLTETINVQIGVPRLGIGPMSIAANPLNAYGTTQVIVPVSVNGKPVSGTYSVNFYASCGSFTPATAQVDAAGNAVSKYTSAAACAGEVTLTATVSAQGTLYGTKETVTVLQAEARNLHFMDVNPSIIYSQQALNGPKTSLIQFKLVDEAGSGVDGASIRFALSAAADAAGVQFVKLDGTRTKTTTSTTANGGIVAVTVQSGDLPGPISITAEYVLDPAIRSESGFVVVNSGAPVQTAMSLATSSANIEGWENNGQISTISISIADRLGQPVPDGTAISFIAEGGQINASCSTIKDGNGLSGCSVKLQSQAPRPADGRVTVLAYAQGVEPFTDLNGNNKYDLGEPFVDLGQPYLDKNENGNFEAGTDQRVGVALPGWSACAAPPAGTPSSYPGTCDGVYGKALIRASAVIAFSTRNADTAIEFFGAAPNSGGFRFWLKDGNGNAMPMGSTLAVRVVTGGISCTASISPATVPSTPNKTLHRVQLTAPDDGTCLGTTIRITVKTPQGEETALQDVQI